MPFSRGALFPEVPFPGSGHPEEQQGRAVSHQVAAAIGPKVSLSLPRGRQSPEVTLATAGDEGRDADKDKRSPQVRKEKLELAQELPEVPQNPLLPLPASGFHSSSTWKGPNSCFPPNPAPSPAALRAFLLSHLPEALPGSPGSLRNRTNVWEWLWRCKLVELDFRKQL